MKKFLSTLLAAVMVMGLLTACGGSDASGNETQDATAPEAKEEAAPEAQEEAEPVEEGAEQESADADAAASEVLADGVLTVGTNAEFPPFEYVDDNGEPDGFDIALIKARSLALRWKWKIWSLKLLFLLSEVRLIWQLPA